MPADSELASEKGEGIRPLSLPFSMSRSGAGVTVSSGDFGTAVDTTIVSVPFTFGYRTEQLEVSASIPLPAHFDHRVHHTHARRPRPRGANAGGPAALSPGPEPDPHATLTRDCQRGQHEYDFRTGRSDAQWNLSLGYTGRPLAFRLAMGLGQNSYRRQG